MFYSNEDYTVSSAMADSETRYFITYHTKGCKAPKVEITHEMFKLYCNEFRKARAFVCRYTKVDVAAKCHSLEVNEQELETVLFDIISKQAEVVLNVDNLEDAGSIEQQFGQQSAYMKLIDKCQEDKRHLYERFVMGEIDAEQHKALKSELDAELSRLNRAYTTLASRGAQMQADDMANIKAQKIAGGISKEAGLTRTLVDLLIDKVYVYPENQIEIVWKVTDFSKCFQGTVSSVA